MLTYQKRERLLMRLIDVPLQFPAVGEVKFTLAPGGPFGVGELSGRLLRAETEYSASPELNTGRIVHTTHQELDAISATLPSDEASVRVEGNVLTVRQAFSSENDLLDLIEWINYGLPVVMSLQFIDAPVITAVTGNLGGVEFVWAYVNYPGNLDPTTKELQEQRFLVSWKRLNLLRPVTNRRLFAALSYFHVACRLALVGISAWEFAGEIIVNLAKVLEVLFPAPPQQTINAATTGLKNLGFSDNDIQKWYVPIIRLRNQVDAGHVSLADLSQEQLTQIHDYTSHVEKAFRYLLTVVTDRVAAGTSSFPPYRVRDKDIERIVRRLSEHNYSNLDLESLS